MQFFCFRSKIPFLGKFRSKIQKCQFKLKFGTWTNNRTCMQNSRGMFTFSVLDRKYPFWANLVQKFKNVSLSWNLAPKLIPICRIQWWWLFFCFKPENPFWSNLVQKIKIVSFSWNLVAGLIRICKIQWCCSLFLL